MPAQVPVARFIITNEGNCDCALGAYATVAKMVGFTIGVNKGAITKNAKEAKEEVETRTKEATQEAENETKAERVRLHAVGAVDESGRRRHSSGRRGPRRPLYMAAGRLPEPWHGSGPRREEAVLATREASTRTSGRTAVWFGGVRVG